MSILLLGTLINHASAQNFGYQQGYVVANSGDTIKGQVKYLNAVPFRILYEIKFKETDDSKVREYAPADLIGYNSGDITFHSLEVPESGYRQFMELVIDGPLRLYIDDVTPSGMGAYGSYTDQYLLKIGDKKLFSVNGSKFKERLSEYLSDNRKLADKIKNGEYKKKDVRTIVIEYNKAKAPN